MMPYPWIQYMYASIIPLVGHIWQNCYEYIYVIWCLASILPFNIVYQQTYLKRWVKLYRKYGNTHASAMLIVLSLLLLIWYIFYVDKRRLLWLYLGNVYQIIWGSVHIDHLYGCQLVLGRRLLSLALIYYGSLLHLLSSQKQATGLVNP